jgi:hypothetical protein
MLFAQGQKLNDRSDRTSFPHHFVRTSERTCFYSGRARAVKRAESELFSVCLRSETATLFGLTGTHSKAAYIVALLCARERFWDAPRTQQQKVRVILTGDTFRGRR